MAFAHVANRGTNSAKAAGASLDEVLAAGQDIGLDRLVLVWAAWDSSDVVGAETTRLTASDEQSNAYARAVEWTEAPDVAGTGVTAFLAYAVTATPPAEGDFIRVTSTDGVRVAKVLSVEEFSKSAGMTIAVEDYDAEGGTGGGAFAATLADMPEREYLLAGGLVYERGDHTTLGFDQDDDYTDIGFASTLGGAANSNLSLFGGFRIATLTGDTYGVSVGAAAGECAHFLVAFYEVAEDGGVTISGVGAIPSAEAVGAARTIRALRNAGAVVTGEAVGAAKALRTVRNAGAVASLEALGAPRAYRLLTGVGGVASAEAHGTARIVRVLAQAGALASAEAFGEPAVSIVVVSEADISAAGGIASAEAFGVAQLIRRLANGGGIVSGEAFGASRLIRPLGTAGISSAEAHGAPRLLRLLAASGIASEETVGAPRVLRVVFAHSITTGETFGTATVGEFEPPPPGTEPAFGKVFLSDAPRYQVIVSDGETWLVQIRDIPIGDVLIEDQLRG